MTAASAWGGSQRALLQRPGRTHKRRLLPGSQSHSGRTGAHMLPDFPEEGMTLAELEVVMPRLLAQARAERHRRGVWFVRARRVIDVAGSALDLDRAATAAGLLDSLLQIGLRTEPQRLRDV